MGYLIYKIVFMLMSAAGFGAALAWWWMRRHYEDVTLEHSRWVENWDQWRQRFEAQLAARPAADLSPLADRLTDIERRIDGIVMPPPAPAPDLAPVLLRLAELERAVAGIRIPAPVATDLAPVTSRLATFESALRALQIPAARDVDLAPVLQQLGGLRERVESIRLPEPAPPQPVDLEPLHCRLQALEATLAGLRFPDPTPATDLQPLTSRLETLDRTLAGALAEWRSRPAPTAPAPEPLSAPSLTRDMIRSGSRNLLTHAALGKPDDLQRIKGVADVLERMLHGIGVYYFWQIAEWTPEDVAHVDRQLTAFKGRILRDHWVRQSQGFAAEPAAARKPAG